MLSIVPYLRHPSGRLLVTGFVLLAMMGCRTSRIEPLMPTPLVYSEFGVGPLDHIPEAERWKLRRVYYATTRERTGDLQRIDYGNRESDRLSVGIALVGFGGPEMTWSDLNKASRTAEREDTVLLSMAGLMEAGNVAFSKTTLKLEGPIAWLFADMNSAIEKARDKDLLIYVHGAKVNFYNACVFAAQLDHFTGRDMTSLAFAWPTRQRITAYASGADVRRGYGSAPALKQLLNLLAEHSAARRIHLVAWSAGGRVLTRAVSDLRRAHAALTPEQLRDRFRLGTLYFAASDVPREDFLDALPDLDAMAHRVVVSTSSNDGALKQARIFMGGGPRIGQLSDGLEPEQQEVLRAAKRLEVIDVSLDSEERGFDITGHRYWFNHPWASTDLLLTVRSDLGPAERGLQATSHPMLWGLPPDYPERLRASMLRPDLEIRKNTGEDTSAGVTH